MKNPPKIEIREILEFEEFENCLDLQREVFKFPELDVSPRRNLIVARRSGGFTLGAFKDGKMIGFAVTLPAFRGEERIYYSQMAAVLPEYQSFGVGAKLKWKQRKKALQNGIKFIKWTFQPVQARNAYFNLEKLGAVVRQYIPNFYGTGFSNTGDNTGVESDRLYAEWELESEKVVSISEGKNYKEEREVAETIEIPNDWNKMLSSAPEFAKKEQKRIKDEFQKAFAKDLICSGFERDKENSRFLLYKT